MHKDKINEQIQDLDSIRFNHRILIITDYNFFIDNVYKKPNSKANKS